MVNLGPLAAEICWRVWGTPANFNGFLHLGSVTARHSSSGRHPKFAVLNRGCHLHSAGWPSRWALAHIVVSYLIVAHLDYPSTMHTSTSSASLCMALVPSMINNWLLINWQLVLKC